LHAKNNNRTDIRFFAFEPSAAKVRFIRQTVKANYLTVKVIQGCFGEECRDVVQRREEKELRGLAVTMFIKKAAVLISLLLRLIFTILLILLATIAMML
jgi:hypothetical protein